MSLFRNKSKGSARSQIGIKEVRDNILVLPGKRYRSIIKTSSVNFELQSEAEQDVLIENFSSFLNSLSIPVQILIRVRELDIDRYLENLQAGRTDETEVVYKKQLQNYTHFIRKLVSGNRILSRRFYVVVAYDNKAQADFGLVKEQLHLEQEIIIKGLEKLGMTARPLTGLEILDLFYGFYRPETAKTQPLVQEILERGENYGYF